MYQVANRWMKKPTPVITPSMTSDRPSRRSAKLRREAVDGHPGPQHLGVGAALRRVATGIRQPISSVSSADRPIEPTPTIAAGFSGSRPRANARIRKPSEREHEHQWQKVEHVLQPFILLSSVDIERLEALIELQHQRQADRDFGSGQREDQDEHDLAVRLPPAAAGDDEGQRGGVQHDLQTTSA